MERLGYTFRDASLLEHALTHSSYAMATHCPMGDNERMEYLGDAVLELLVSRYLFDTFPGMKEGAMTRARASLVCVGLREAVLLGHGEEQCGGRDKPSILSDAFEAVLCAVYLDGGLEKARELVERTVLTQADQRLLPKKDSKTSLQEYVHKDHKNTVIRYELLEESGPDHQKSFRMQVRIGGQVMGEGTGHSKQSAGQEAARAALEALKHS